MPCLLNQERRSEWMPRTYRVAPGEHMSWYQDVRRYRSGGCSSNVLFLARLLKNLERDILRQVDIILIRLANIL